MESMEQEYDLSELIRQQPGPEVFRRVWDRVMPDQRDSPLILAAPPGGEAVPPAPAPAPEPTPEPAPVPEPAPSPAEPPLGLGEASQPDTAALAALMDRARENLSAAWALARRRSPQGGGRALSELAADHSRATRQLSAAYFLITGTRYRPAEKKTALPASLPLALRDQFVREQRWERACRRAAEATGDPCLRELYLELAQDGALHAGTIRSLLERM